MRKEKTLRSEDKPNEFDEVVLANVKKLETKRTKGNNCIAGKTGARNGPFSIIAFFRSQIDFLGLLCGRRDDTSFVTLENGLNRATVSSFLVFRFAARDLDEISAGLFPLS